MADYIGEKCIICGKTFEKGDDIVVCPDCGTPYHRDCFQKEGRCINTGLHSSGKTWQGENEKKVTVRCMNCGTENNADANVCIKCGAPLKANANNNANQNNQRQWQNQNNANGQNNQNNQNTQNNGTFSGAGFSFENGAAGINFDDPYAGMNPESTIDGVKVKNLSSFIGSNRFYFLVLFKKFAETASRFSTNLACMFFPQLYFAYRKMWKWFWAVTIAFTVIAIPNVLYNLATLDTLQVEQVTSGGGELAANFLTAISAMVKPHKVVFWNLYVIGEGISLAARVLFFCFANYLYYKHTIKKVHEIETGESKEYAQQICTQEGGTKVSNIFLAVLLEVAVDIVATMVLFVILIAMI